MKIEAYKLIFIQIRKEVKDKKFVESGIPENLLLHLEELTIDYKIISDQTFKNNVANKLKWIREDDILTKSQKD